MTKEKLLNHIKDNPNIKSHELIHLINGISYKGINRPPTKIKKGDVIKSRDGSKSRPAVVIKVTKDLIYMIPLSTHQDEMNLMPYNSRIFGNGYYSKSIISSKYEYAYENWLGVFDNTKELNLAIKKIMRIFNKLF